MPSILTEDGSHSYISDEFGVLYHSIHGAIQETQHVFIDAGLKYMIQQNIATIHILEIGFGTGLNALMTYLEAAKQGVKIHYTTYEKYPLSIEAAASLNYGQIWAGSEPVFNQLHTSDWEQTHELSPFFIFEKRQKSFETIDIQNSINVIYFDAFAPEIQPHLWEQAMMQKMYDALKTGGILTTYCAKGVVKRALKSVGFKIEPLQGPPGKREITRAVK